MPARQLKYGTFEYYDNLTGLQERRYNREKAAIFALLDQTVSSEIKKEFTKLFEKLERTNMHIQGSQQAAAICLIKENK